MGICRKLYNKGKCCEGRNSSGELATCHVPINDIAKCSDDYNGGMI